MEGINYHGTPSRSTQIKPRQLNSTQERPLSYYDNFRGGIIQPSSADAPSTRETSEMREKTEVSDQNNSSKISQNNRNSSEQYNNVIEQQCGSDSKPFTEQTGTEMPEGSPSLTHCLVTTVPQNIAGSYIAGRHTPTRNSLRHSRMIVLSRGGKGDKYTGAVLVRGQGLARALVGLQTLLGFMIACVTIWLLVWAPNIHWSDNPYWSCLPLLASGIFGLQLLGCCRPRKKTSSHRWILHSVKVISIFLSVVAAVACFTACIFALLHLVTLSNMVCEPPHAVNVTCICHMPSSSDNSTDPIYTYHYVDLNCPEVNSILTVVLIFSCAANGLAVIVATWYIYVHWANRLSYSYSTVRTKEDRAT